MRDFLTGTGIVFTVVVTTGLFFGILGTIGLGLFFILMPIFGEALVPLFFVIGVSVLGGVVYRNDMNLNKG